MNSRRAVVVGMLLGLAPLLPGCDRKGLDRLPVHGTVTVAHGEKLTGSITFLPAGGRSGPAANTSLVEGSYKFDRSNGPTAGPHSVIVKRVVRREEQIKSLSNRMYRPPAKSEWTQSADVSNDGEYVLDFTWKD